MKLLFCGPINDFSGFGHASRHFLRALDCSDIDLVARPLIYDQLDEGQEFVPDEWHKKLMEKSITKGVDAVIQMTTANAEAQPVPGCMNILYSFFETDRIPGAWAQHANNFDAIAVPCRMNVESLLRSGVTKPIINMPVPCDKDVFDKEYDPYDLGKKAEGRTVFYNICQLSAKKGIDSLLRSYYAAFADRPDEVLLVLKTYIGMANRNLEQEKTTVRQFIDRVWQGARIPVEKRPPVLPILGTVSDDMIHGLHKRGDVYVCSSRGEGWGIPVFDAMAHGNVTISHPWGGMEHFVTNESAIVYGGSMALCYDMPHPDPVLFNGTCQWFEPSTAEMSMMMRNYHLLKQQAEKKEFAEGNREQWESVLNRQKKAAKVSEAFDYRAISGQIAAIIAEAFESWKLTGDIIINKEATQ
jgi:glycosyltransferase involved in cell wall biosynthesis